MESLEVTNIMKIKNAIILLFLLFISISTWASSTQTMIFDKSETILSDTNLIIQLQKNKFSNDSSDQKSAFLLAHNEIFKEDWVNDVAFPYKATIDILPDSVNIPLISNKEKFTLTWYGQLNSTFKYRWGRHHNGLDIDLKIGDTIVAAFDGIVRYAQFNTSGFGNCVIIRHLNGLETVYGHMSKLIVIPNQYVTSGQPIGLGGSTGHSTGPHLHLETRYKDIPFDPQLIIDVNTQQLKKDTFTLYKDYLTAYKSQSTNQMGSGTNTDSNKTNINNQESALSFKTKFHHQSFQSNKKNKTIKYTSKKSASKSITSKKIVTSKTKHNKKNANSNIHKNNKNKTTNKASSSKKSKTSTVATKKKNTKNTGNKNLSKKGSMTSHSKKMSPVKPKNNSTTKRKKH